MKWISIADAHLRTQESLGVVEGGFNSRVIDKLESLKTVAMAAVKPKVDAVFILGDLFDSINPAERIRAYFAKMVLAPLLEAGVEVVFIPGDHDQSKVRRVHNFLAEKVINISKFTVVSEPKVINWDGVKFLVIPWLADSGEIENIIKDNHADVLLGHFGVNTALMGAKNVKFKGGVDPSIFAKFKSVQLGHFHKHQRCDNWMYVGSVAKEDFGELGEDKGYVLSEFKEGKVKSEFHVVADREFVVVEIREGDKGDVKSYPEAIVKVRMMGSKEWINSYDVVKLKGSLNAHKVIVEREWLTADRKGIRVIKPSDVLTPEIVLADYVKEKRGKADKGLVEAGLKYYKRANKEI